MLAAYPYELPRRSQREVRAGCQPCCGRCMADSSGDGAAHGVVPKNGRSRSQAVPRSCLGVLCSPLLHAKGRSLALPYAVDSQPRAVPSDWDSPERGRSPSHRLVQSTRPARQLYIQRSSCDPVVQRPSSIVRRPAACPEARPAARPFGPFNDSSGVYRRTTVMFGAKCPFNQTAPQINAMSMRHTGDAA